MKTSKFAAPAAVLFACSFALSVQARATDTPTAAETAATPPAAAQPAANGPNPNQMICKLDGEIGSRLGGDKECHTRAQWAQMARDKASAAAGKHGKSAPDSSSH